MDQLSIKKWPGDTLFRVNLTTQPENSVSQPLSTEFFPGLGIFCLPHIGVYGNDYWPSELLAVIQLNNNISKYESILPSNLLESIKKLVNGIDSLSVYCLIHDVPTYGECQKFECSNSDEFNVMFHTWTFPDYHNDYNSENEEVFEDIDASVSTKILVGAFNLVGVKGVHLNLEDSGIPIEELGQMSVIIHDISFSPENMKLQVDHSHEIAHFYTLANHLGRTIIVYHIVATNESSSQKLRSICTESTSLEELVTALSENSNNFGETLRSLVINSV